MKMATSNVNTIERVGVGADQEFTIDFSAKMASILADGLYSDKIQSVIRELSCNAYDSQVAAGRADTPIEVHFPNRFEPWFHVRDFGTGLSHDEVMTIYTRYGASTKTNSNDFIGALGLGSKSPFAITEAFTVTARKDGVENHYSMYRNESGMPSVAHLHQAATTEPNGVTVTVPVREDQRSEFIEKSRQVYKWFPVKPNTVGDSVDYETVQYEYQGTGWGIRKAQLRRGYYGHHANTERPVAIMGLVAYPLDSNSVKGLSEGARELLDTSVVLTFAIGELEIAANREALGYDERTCAAIVAKMDTMVAELGAVFEKQIATADTLWNARKRFGEIFTKGDYANNFSRAYRHLGLSWKATVIKDNRASFVASKLYGLTDTKYANCDFYLANHSYKRPRRLPFAENESYEIECADHSVIVYNDLKLGGLTRITEYNKSTNGSKRIYVFPNNEKVTVDRIRKVLGNPEVILTSSLPRPERKAPARTGVYQHVGAYNNGSRKAWKETEIDLEQGGCYVDLDGWDHVWNGKHIGEVGWWLQRGVELGAIAADTVIYAMRSKNKKVVAEHPDWFNLIDRVKEYFDAILQKRDLGRDLAYGEEYSRLCNTNHLKLWESNREIKDPTSPMIAFINTVKQYKSASDGLSNIQILANRFGVEVSKGANDTDLVSEWARMLERYPMLSFAFDRYSYSRMESSATAKLFDYINFVDATAVFVALQDREETN